MMIDRWYNIHGLVKIHLSVGELNSARVIDSLLVSFRSEPIDSLDVDLEFFDSVSQHDYSRVHRAGLLHYRSDDRAIWDSNSLLRSEPGGKLSIHSDRGVDEYVLALLLMIQLARRGYALCHALGIVVEDRAFIFPAWHATGKTGVLSFMVGHDDVGLLGDDQVILSRGGEVWRLSYPIKLQSYHTSEGSGEVNKAFRRKRSISLSRVLSPLYGKAAGPALSTLSAVSPKLAQVVHRFSPRRYARVPMEELVAEDRIPNQAPLRKAVSLTRYSGNSLQMEPCDRGEMVTEMVSMLDCSELFNPSARRFIQYWQTMAAFGVVESWQQLLSSLEQILGEALRDIECYRLSIPEDTRFAELGQFMMARVVS